ncbi:ATPase GET3-like protein [Carex littledalei]|uniref:ATPase GET3-like protein n=1 Tax=Carex littledalei TaxID=544730 RepID=A0A833V5C0_9POAL|nr:ATPase GET3-like protein [Carex littledalei]
MGEDNLRWDRGLHDFRSLLSLKEAPPLPDLMRIPISTSGTSSSHGVTPLLRRCWCMLRGHILLSSLCIEINPEKGREEFCSATQTSGGTGVKDFMDNMGLGMIEQNNSLEACQGDVDSGTSTVSLMTWWLMHSRVKEDMSKHARTMMVMYRVTSWLKWLRTSKTRPNVVQTSKPGGLTSKQTPWHNPMHDQYN